MASNEPFIVRVGMFFLVLGAGALVLFIISDIAKQTEFDYLFIGMLLIGIGWMLRRKKTPPPPSGRFARVRGLLKRGKGAKTSPSSQEESGE